VGGKSAGNRGKSRPLSEAANLLRRPSNRLLKNVVSAGKTRQNPTKKRSLWLINEYFEEDFNAVLPSAIVFQQPDKDFFEVFK